MKRNLLALSPWLLALSLVLSLALCSCSDDDKNNGQGTSVSLLEPCIDWGKNVDEVKNIMKVAGYSLPGEDEDGDGWVALYYEGKDKAELEKSYEFLDNKLMFSQVILNSGAGSVNDILTSLRSKYSEQKLAKTRGDSDDIDFERGDTYYFTSKDGNTVIQFRVITKDNKTYYKLNYWDKLKYTKRSSDLHFTDPCIDWGNTVKQVKSFMADEGYAMPDEDDDGDGWKALYYDGRDGEVSKDYEFQNNKLYTAQVVVRGNVVTEKQILDAILESFTKLGENLYKSEDGKTILQFKKMVKGSETRYKLNYWDTTQFPT